MQSDVGWWSERHGEVHGNDLLPTGMSRPFWKNEAIDSKGACD
jgi:hypothetical protein